MQLPAGVIMHCAGRQSPSVLLAYLQLRAPVLRTSSWKEIRITLLLLKGFVCKAGKHIRTTWSCSNHLFFCWSLPGVSFHNGRSLSACGCSFPDRCQCSAFACMGKSRCRISMFCSRDCEMSSTPVLCEYKEQEPPHPEACTI